MKDYWRNINIASKTLKTGLKLTIKHMRDATQQRDPLAPSEDNYFEKENALFTVQYPKEVLPVPTIGRYKLHNEIDDCIVCDKCAKICPVDCIDIEPVRATEEIGKTSDGTSKRIHAAKFDIDMGKCCFCGLCTTVCPTECLTMTDEYDFSAYDIKEHNFAFAIMTPLEILAKKQELEEFNKKKEEEKKAKATEAIGAKSTATQPKVGGAAKPVFKPKVMGAAKPKIAMKPKAASDSAKPKVVIKPKVQPKKEDMAEAKAKPVMKPKIPSGTAKPKPVIKPKITPKAEGSEDSTLAKPKMKPKIPMKPKVPPRKEGEE